MDYRDDPTIAPSAELLRRVHESQIVPDRNAGRMRVSTSAFDNSSDGSPMSVSLLDELKARGLGPEAVLLGYPALISITAGLARNCAQGVAREPTRDDPAHAVVFGEKTGSIKRKFAKQAKWVIPEAAPPLVE